MYLAAPSVLMMPPDIRRMAMVPIWLRFLVHWPRVSRHVGSGIRVDMSLPAGSRDCISSLAKRAESTPVTASTMNRPGITQIFQVRANSVSSLRSKEVKRFIGPPRSVGRRRPPE